MLQKHVVSSKKPADDDSSPGSILSQRRRLKPSNCCSLDAPNFSASRYRLLQRRWGMNALWHERALSGKMCEAPSQEDVQLQQRLKREKAAGAEAQRQQHHLQDQFLDCNTVRKRIDRIATPLGVRPNMEGVFLRQDESVGRMNHPGTEGIARANERTMPKPEERPESVVNQGVPLEQILSLISLAAEERTRDLLDNSYGLARARRYGEHGRVVPPEFAGISEGDATKRNETIVPENITGTPWDGVPRSDEMDVDPTSSSTPQPNPTVAYHSILADALRSLAKKDKLAERAREKKRQSRKRAAETSPADGADGTPTSASTPTATAVETAAPRLSKKELAKAQKERLSADQTAANQTATMMAVGKKGRSRYSWMTGAASAMPTNRFAKPTPGTSTPTRNTADADAAEKPARDVEWGDWREEDGPRIELRDWLLVMERDGRHRTALQKTLDRM